MTDIIRTSMSYCRLKKINKIFLMCNFNYTCKHDSNNHYITLGHGPARHEIQEIFLLWQLIDMNALKSTNVWCQLQQKQHKHEINKWNLIQLTTQRHDLASTTSTGQTWRAKICGQSAIITSNFHSTSRINGLRLPSPYSVLLSQQMNHALFQSQYVFHMFSEF